MDTDVGQRIHRVIAALAGGTPGRGEVLDAVHDLWRTDPCGGTTQASSRLRCATAVNVYFSRCRPDRRWTLEAAELRLDEAVADLVWLDKRGRVVIDEVKSGKPDPMTDPDLADQLRRLHSGGVARWGDRFLGVRLVPLSAPARTSLYRIVGSGLTTRRPPAGMTVP